jgi:hypothetical protein
MHKIAKRILMVTIAIGLLLTCGASVACCTCGNWNPTTISTTGTTPFHNPPGNLNNWSMQSISAGTPVNVTASLGCIGCGANSYTWTVTRTFTTPPGCDTSTEPSQVSSQPSTWSGSGSTATFTPVCAGVFTVEFKAKCGGNSCPSDTVIVAIDSITGKSAGAGTEGTPFACFCKWNDMTVTWDGSSPGTWTGSCGSTPGSIVINSGTHVNINSSANCIPSGCAQPVYQCQVTGPGGFNQTYSALPFDFYPTTGGGYTVTLNANCSGSPCSQCVMQIKIQIEGGDCSCTWNTATVTWTGPGTWTNSYPNTPGSIGILSGTSVNINASANCIPSGCNQPFYQAHVTDPNGSITPYSLPFSFNPIIVGLYTITLDASCDGSLCRQWVMPIDIGIKDTGTTACKCEGWYPVTVTWDGSPPRTWTGPCGSTVTIPWVNYSTNVVISSRISCSPTNCESTIIYGPGFTNPGPNGSISFAVTQPISGYTSTFGALCGNTQCQNCNVTINVLHIGPGPWPMPNEPLPQE